eukprot:scaffold116294_cov63-Phaeocystis_antarctica.AAC.5
MLRLRPADAQASASWLSGGLFQRQSMPQAAPNSGQPRPIGLMGRAGRPCRPRVRHSIAPLCGPCSRGSPPGHAGGGGTGTASSWQRNWSARSTRESRSKQPSMLTPLSC